MHLPIQPAAYEFRRKSVGYERASLDNIADAVDPVHMLSSDHNFARALAGEITQQQHPVCPKDIHHGLLDYFLQLSKIDGFSQPFQDGVNHGELRLLVLNFLNVATQVSGHLIEAARQLCQLVTSAYGDAHRQIPSSQLPHTCHEAAHGTRHQCGCHEQCHGNKNR